MDENIGTIAEYCKRHEQRATPAQKVVEKISLFLGSPGYFATNMAFVLCWLVWNSAASFIDLPQPDEPPFFWLQGFVSLNAFIISTTVLIRQNRMSKLADRNAHLDLQISLLADEKTSKIIAMLEEIRRDSPNLADKPDDKAEELAKPADTTSVLEAIDRKTR
ncbi:hypothetical protein ASF77_12165 [Massilia sp. Leaf139]|nr:hypothetical protein ASF77_12165 [Massilia sp. Leaf139]